MTIEWKVECEDGEYSVVANDSRCPASTGKGKTPLQALENLVECLSNDASELERVLGLLKHEMGILKERERAASSEDVFRLTSYPCPDWSQAPEGVKFFAVDASGKGFWYRSRPLVVQDFWRVPVTADMDKAGDFFIPLGIDWRLTLQEKPEDE